MTTTLKNLIYFPTLPNFPPIQYGKKFHNVKATYMEIYWLGGGELYNLQHRGIFVRDDEACGLEFGQSVKLQRISLGKWKLSEKNVYFWALPKLSSSPKLGQHGLLCSAFCAYVVIKAHSYNGCLHVATVPPWVRRKKYIFIGGPALQINRGRWLRFQHHAKLSFQQK